MATCNTCTQLIEKQLCNIPSSWRAQIANVLCNYAEGGGINIPEIPITSLSAWTITEDFKICISYKDGAEVTTQRCFDLPDILNQQLNQLDAKCIATPDVWQSLSYLGKLQAQIDRICLSCVPNGEEAPVPTTTLPPVGVGGIWFGSSPISTITEIDILLTDEVLVDPEGNIDIDWTLFNESPSYLWFVVPETAPKTHYQDLVVSFNQGHIGDDGDLFGPPESITVGGTASLLYKTAYLTQFEEIIRIS